MNMNTSGHMEVTAREEPDWYKNSLFDTDRAKLSPNTLETESLQNSGTSLNFDSLTVADLEYAHYSVRSLPVISSSTSGHYNNSSTSQYHHPIASASDAPWNESPRSLRGSPHGRQQTNRFHNQQQQHHHPRSIRSSVNSNAPPAGVSALDHLQNSISSLAGGMGASSYRPSPLPRNIMTDELVDVDYSEDDGYETLEGSFGSLRLVMEEQNEMDTTAHAGNVTRMGGGGGGSSFTNLAAGTGTGTHYHPSSSAASLAYYPSSPPQRSVSSKKYYPPSSPANRSPHRATINSSASLSPRQHQPYAMSPAPSSPQRSITSQFLRGGDSIASSRGSRPRGVTTSPHRYSYHNSNEHSLSTLGDEDDGYDEDDDNVSIIKLLSKQVETLKKQLLEQQQQNHTLQHQTTQLHASKSSIMDNFFPNDSLLHREDVMQAAAIADAAGFIAPNNSSLNSKSTHSTKSFGHDYSECDSFGEDKDDHSCGSSSTAAGSLMSSAGTNGANLKLSRQTLLSTQSAIFGAIAALKASLLKQQLNMAGSKSLRFSVPPPVVSMSENQQHDPLYDETEVAIAANNSGLVGQDHVTDLLDDEHLLMDELVVCELEAHVKTLQRVVNHQQLGWMATNARLQAQVDEQAARIAQLEAAASNKL